MSDVPEKRYSVQEYDGDWQVHDAQTRIIETGYNEAEARALCKRLNEQQQ